MQRSAALNTGSLSWTQERLDSWKEIASYFQRDVRTVQLWEKNEGLPIRRQQHKKLGSIFAYRHELEAWWETRSTNTSDRGEAVWKSCLQSSAVEAATTRCCSDASSQDEVEPLLVLVCPFAVNHSPLNRGPMRQIVARFAEGLRDELVVQLLEKRWRPIMVPSHKFVESSGSAPPKWKEISKAYKAKVVLRGQIRYAANQLVVSVQAIRALDSLAVWSDRFEIRLDNIALAQGELADLVLAALPTEAIQDHCRARASNGLVNHRLATHASSVGFHHWRQRGATSLMKALGYFRDAVELDPDCAEAYAGLADTYISLSYNHLMPARQAAAQAAKAVEAAVKIDADLMPVRNARLNLLINCNWDWLTAERRCQEAMDSGKVNARTVQLYANLMNCMGRHEDAVTLALHGYRRDPKCDFVSAQVAVSYFYAGDYANATDFIQRAKLLQPQYLLGYALKGRVSAELGNWQDAISSFTQGLEVADNSAFLRALLSYACVGAGDESRARELLHGLEEESHDACFPAYDVAAVYAKLGQQRDSLHNIYRAYAMRDMKTCFIEHDPRFERLRSSSGFQHMATELGSGGSALAAM